MTETLGIHPEAEKEILELEKPKRKRVDHHIQRFKKEGTSYKHFGRLTAENLDMFRIKIKEQKPIEINQRVILDRFYDQWMIWGVEHREQAYQSEYINLIRERDYSVE